jgi:O-antigen/teichoic acid export membrane protein
MRRRVVDFLLLFKNDKFFRSSAIVFSASFLVNILNYVFNLLMARMVDVEVYGEYASLSSLLLLFTVVASSMVMFVSREIATHSHRTDHSENFLNKTFSEIVLLSVIMWVIFLLISPWMSEFLKIPKQVFFIFSLLIPLSIINSFQVGYFQGNHNFLMSSLLNIVSTFGKLLFCLLLVYLGFNIYGIIVGLILASVLGIFFDRSAYRGRIGVHLVSGDLKEVGKHLIALTFFTTLGLASSLSQKTQQQK